MSWIDVVRIGPVNQQHRKCGAFDRRQRAGLKKIDAVARLGIDGGSCNDGPPGGASEPVAQVEKAGDTLVAHLSRGRERIFNRDGTETRLGRQGLHYKRRSQRFSKAVNALRRIMMVEP